MPTAHTWEPIPAHGAPIDSRCLHCGQLWLEGDPVPATACQPAPPPANHPPKMTLSEIKSSATRTAYSATGAPDELRHLAHLVALLAERIEAQAPAPEVEHVLTVSELAARWKRSAETIRRMIRRREIATVRGRQPYEIAMREVLRFENRTVFLTV